MLKVSAGKNKFYPNYAYYQKIVNPTLTDRNLPIPNLPKFY